MNPSLKLRSIFKFFNRATV